MRTMPPKRSATAVINAKALTCKRVEGNLKTRRQPLKPGEQRLIGEWGHVERKRPVSDMRCGPRRRGRWRLERQYFKRQHGGVATVR
jgi:hypothetical protein